LKLKYYYVDKDLEVVVGYLLNEAEEISESLSAWSAVE
jgi:hypothetical protein